MWFRTLLKITKKADVILKYMLILMAISNNESDKLRMLSPLLFNKS